MSVSADQRIGELDRRRMVVDDLLSAAGVSWRLDPIPYEIAADEFALLARAICQRVVAFEAILTDLYGERRLISERVIPAAAVFASPRYAMSAIGVRAPRRWLTCVAVDVVRLAGGSWRFVADHTDSPSGLGSMLLHREAMARAAPGALEAGSRGVTPVHGVIDRLHGALTGLATVESPRVVVFSGGHARSSHVEHVHLAAELGFHLAVGADLVVRRKRLWLRTLDGLQPVDVAYRRMDDDAVDPLEGASTGRGGVPGLLHAVATGALELANAHGAALIEGETLRPHLADAAAALGCAFPTIETWSPAADPPLANAPVLAGATVDERPVVIRLHAVVGESGVHVAPGGVGNVLGVGHDPAHEFTGLAKDVWVRGLAAPSVIRPAALPQVDLAAVPTRVANTFYWMNIAAERAGAVATAARAVENRLRVHHATGDDTGAWMRVVIELLRAVCSDADTGADEPHGDPQPGERAGDLVARVIAQLDSCSDAIVRNLDVVLTDTLGVAEYLSSSASRALDDLADQRARIAKGRTMATDGELLGHLAALAGLWHESTIRGPAWWIGDLGRRLERAVCVLDTSAAAVRQSLPEEVGIAAFEVVLEANESLVAYRRRFRSRVDATVAANLLLRDESNPHSYGAAVTAMAAHVAALEWADGARIVERAMAALHEPRPETLVTHARAAVSALADAVEAHWFSVPVNPAVVRSRR